MRYVLQVVLSNAQHPEYGQATIPFPIPNQNYDSTIELLGPLEIGDTLRQDCQVDELDSFYTVLNTLIGTQVTLDELDYLAKRLDSFDDGEAAQFQGMAHKLGLSEIKDLINLTFCCQKITVITDFSDLEKIGREHYMNLNGGCARTEDLEALDGTETAYLLIDSEAGTVTPYGVVYDNGMKLEPLYNGRQFPEYLYDNSGMGLKIVPAENQAPELLWLPASEQQIRRTLLRTGWQDPDHADYTIDVFLLQKEVGEILDEKRDSLDSLNAMCGAIAKLDQKDRAKLEAVIIFAEPENAGEICRLAENLDQFDFIPGVHTPKEYGKYMIQESGRFGYDDHLDAFYDYEGYRRVIWTQKGVKRVVWRCQNRLEHGRKICKQSPTLDEGDIHDAVISAMNELFRMQAAKDAVKAGIAAVLAGEEQTMSLPAVELQIRNLQERQLELFQLIVSAGADCTDYDEELQQVNIAKTRLMAQKAELEKEQRGAAAFESRLAELDMALEQASGTLTDFDELTVRQLVSNIKVLDKDSLLICFKDGTEITQAMQRRQAA